MGAGAVDLIHAMRNAPLPLFTRHSFIYLITILLFLCCVVVLNLSRRVRVRKWGCRAEWRVVWCWCLCYIRFDSMWSDKLRCYSRGKGLWLVACKWQLGEHHLQICEPSATSTPNLFTPLVNFNQFLHKMPDNCAKTVKYTNGRGWTVVRFCKGLDVCVVRVKEHFSNSHITCISVLDVFSK